MPAEESLRARMRKLVAEIREIDGSLVEPTSRLREDLGMDSLGSLELLSSISEQMNVHVDIEDAMGLVTFEDACAFVERCIREQQPTNGAV
jgi:acyl carrier protein